MISREVLDSKIWRSSISVPPSNGARLSHSIASSRDAHSQIQKPATSSLASVNGPSMTVRSRPSKRTLAPFEVGCRPSPASITPALTSSSLYLVIASSSSVLGITPASDSGLAGDQRP